MTPAEFRTIRRALDKTQQQLADALGISIRAVRYYESGGRGIPGPVAKLMEGWNNDR